MPIPTSSTGLSYPSVRGYKLVQLIGGGGFSKVFRAVNATDEKHPVAAVKVISFVSSSSRRQVDRRALQKEVQIHGVLKHVNVLEFIDAEELGTKEQEGNSHAYRYVPGLYMVLELAAGGDLFDKIAPDYGVEEDLAHFYFTQLMAGLEYVHSQGITHRDVKPENLLLDAEGNLKIADFGLCSVYKYKGKQRELNGACGSLPYIAPEMNGTPYRGEPVDVWSSGVVLFALLVGNTPWDEPTQRSPEYMAYTTGELFEHDPWTRIGSDALSLLRKMMHTDPDRRLTIEQVQRDRWFTRSNKLLTAGKCNDPVSLAERLLQGLIVSGDMSLHSDGARANVPENVSLTQPETIQRHSLGFGSHDAGLPSSSAMPALNDRRFGFSQKVRSSRSDFPDAGDASGEQGDIGSGSQFTQALNHFTQWSNIAGSSLRFSPHLTRFFAKADPADVARRLVDALDNIAVQNTIEPTGDDDPLDQGAADAMDADLVQIATIPRSESGALSPGAIGSRGARIRLGTTDKRKCVLKGEIRIEKLIRTDPSPGSGCLVMMRRSKGSPLEWRRLFRELTRHESLAQVIMGT